MSIIKDVDIEYRTLDVDKEKEIEKDGTFIRNFIVKANGHLYGGWSDEAIQIY